MELKIIFSDKIELNELYNFIVHQIYIRWWNHTENYIWKNISIHFLYSLTLTSPSPSVCEKVIHFELTVSTRQLLSSMWPFICSTYWGFSGGFFNFTVSNSGEGDIKKLTFDSDWGSPTTPKTIEKGQKFDY